MRYLTYNTDGGDLAPHTDLSKTTYYSIPDEQYTSTHTFILYLRTTVDCSGETVILNALTNYDPNTGTCTGTNTSANTTTNNNNTTNNTNTTTTSGSSEPYSGHHKRILVSISPVFNRLFVFPHNSPHAANPIHDTPKMLIRGELYIK